MWSCSDDQAHVTGIKLNAFKKEGHFSTFKYGIFKQVRAKILIVFHVTSLANLQDQNSSSYFSLSFDPNLPSFTQSFLILSL
jgi:hypothetical protein